MSKRVQWQALWVTLGLASVFVVIVLAVNHYETELTKINWPLVSIICCFAVAGMAVYQWNTNPGSYDLVDLVKNPKTGKADPYRHFLFVFGGLGAWAVVQVVLAKEWGNLTPLLALLLGYFVAKPTIDGIGEAIASRPVSPEPSGNVQVNAPNADTVNVPPRAAEAATDLEPAGRAKIGKR